MANFSLLSLTEINTESFKNTDFQHDRHAIINRDLPDRKQLAGHDQSGIPPQACSAAATQILAILYKQNHHYK